jgi:cell division protein FtsW (lipid II flippase)
MNPIAIALPCRFRIALLLLLELALTVGAARLLSHWAEPLALPPLAEGLHGRYALAGAGPPLLPPELAAGWQELPLLRELPLQGETKAERARHLHQQAGQGLTLAALLGWLALWVARRQRPGAGWVCSGLWLVAALWLRPLGLPPWIPWALAALCVAGYCGVIVKQAKVADQERLLTGVAASAWSVLGWPGWVGFSGIGLLWVMDFAARGPGQEQYMGLHQADALWLANWLLCLSALWRGRLVMGLAQFATGMAELWQRRRGPWLLGGIGLLLTLALGWVGRPDHAKPLPGWAKPHVSGELLRAVFAYAAAWFLYRVGEWRTSKPRLRAALGRLVCVGLLVLCGLAWSRDGGPALVIALGIFLAAGIPLAHALASRHGLLGLAALMLFACLGWASWHSAVSDVAPSLSRRAAERVALLNEPFRGSRPYLAQIHWLLDATPSTGFGLGRVPWCGAKAHVGAAACTLGSGAALQMPSDYAAAGLAAVFGVPGAALLCLALLVWIASLGWPAVAAWRWGRAPPWALLQCWLVLAFALLAMAQTLITAAGSAGLVPLTGITLPLLSNGAVSLFCSAFWVGLALNPVGVITHVRQGA